MKKCFLLKEIVVDRNRNSYEIDVKYMGVATNNDPGVRCKLGPFLYRNYKRGMKESSLSSMC